MTDESLDSIPFDQTRSYLYMECWTDRSFDLWMDETDEELIQARVQALMESVVPENLRGNVKSLFLPTTTPDKSDPLKQRGYCAFWYIPPGDSADYEDRQRKMDLLFKTLQGQAGSNYTFCIVV